MEKTKKGRREGEVLKGKYRLDRHIATGGMGEVYQATNLALNRIVAVKLLLDEYASQQENVQRFLMEARTASMVQHPNIVQVYDVDETESGVPFIVQEFLHGEPLSRRVHRTRERLPGKLVLDLMIPVVEAIGVAHKAGIVHRDIKPSNIYLAKQDRGVTAKVLDFGISRVTSGTDDVRLTRTTAVLGSPAYMAPEQIRSSRDATTRSDVWSIGVVMYELLAGELPFRGTTSSEVMVNVCSQEVVSLFESAPGISPALADVVTRCLSRRPDERYLDGESLVMALREVQEKDFSVNDSLTRGLSAVTADPNAPRPRQTDTATGRSDTSDGLSIDDTPPHGTASASRTSGSHSRDAGPDPADPQASRHPSYGDIPSIVAAYCALAGLLVIDALFTPPAPGEPGFGTETQIVQLLFAAGVVYLAQWVQRKASQYSDKGTTVSVLGLYGVAATLALSSGASFLGEAGLRPMLSSLLSITVAVSSLGFAFVAFEYVKEQVVAERLITLPGVAVAMFTVVALMAGLHFIYTAI
jgi:serine/threonine-protein kinase